MSKNGAFALCSTLTAVAGCGLGGEVAETVEAESSSTTDTTASDVSGGGLFRPEESDTCEIDSRTLRTAEEAFFTQYGRYASEQELQSQGFLSGQSELHDIQPAPNGTAYDLIVEGQTCGEPGHVVGQTPTDK